MASIAELPELSPQNLGGLTIPPAEISQHRSAITPLSGRIVDSAVRYLLGDEEANLICHSDRCDGRRATVVWTTGGDIVPCVRAVVARSGIIRGGEMYCGSLIVDYDSPPRIYACLRAQYVRLVRWLVMALPGLAGLPDDPDAEYLTITDNDQIAVIVSARSLPLICPAWTTVVAKRPQSSSAVGREAVPA